jgi:hypothetical protein
MAFNLGSLFKPVNKITQQVTAGGGGLRDLYLEHIAEMANQGAAALPWDEWLKQQQAKQQPQLGQ